MLVLSGARGRRAQCLILDTTVLDGCWRLLLGRTSRLADVSVEILREGICQAAQELQGDPEAGQTYELTAIAIVVIGGTNLMGGRGGIGLTFIGAMTIGYLEKILSINAVGEASRLMLTGVIIIGAVLFQRTRQ